MKKYKLNFKRDVDTDEPGVLILDLPGGFKFLHDAWSIEHVRGFESLEEMLNDIKNWVGPCDCDECQRMIAEGK